MDADARTTRVTTRGGAAEDVSGLHLDAEAAACSAAADYWSEGPQLFCRTVRDRVAGMGEVKLDVEVIDDDGDVTRWTVRRVTSFEACRAEVDG